MARYIVKYQMVNPKTKQAGGMCSTNVPGSSIAEARQWFKAHQGGNYKIIAVMKMP